jgi:hypothetical protein
MKGKVKIVRALILDDLATYHVVTWNCRLIPCTFSLFDKSVGGDRSDVFQQMLNHWKETHEWELTIIQA